MREFAAFLMKKQGVSKSTGYVLLTTENTGVLKVFSVRRASVHSVETLFGKPTKSDTLKKYICF
jgi:hypothetical protein